jgi:hypothetical protein
MATGGGSIAIDARGPVVLPQAGIVMLADRLSGRSATLDTPSAGVVTSDAQRARQEVADQ